MIYGVISDIHANCGALRAVLERLGPVDKYYCPGDIVGYGPDPNECCDTILSLDCATALGNHDAAVCGRIDMAWFNPHARKAATWTQERITQGNCKLLDLLPVTQKGDDFIMVHGSLDNPMTFPYIFSAGTARPCFEEMKDYSICFIGHTHLSEVYVQKIGERPVDQLSFVNGGKLDLKPGFRYIVNCGSVGQPRDGNTDASCGIYDSSAGTLEIIRVPYDIPAVQERMRTAGLPDFLIERLDRGQ